MTTSHTGDDWGLAAMVLERHLDELTRGLSHAMVAPDEKPDLGALEELATRLRATLQIGLAEAYEHDLPGGTLLRTAYLWSRRLRPLLPAFDWKALWPPFDDEQRRAQGHEQKLLRDRRGTGDRRVSPRDRVPKLPGFDPYPPPVYSRR